MHYKVRMSSDFNSPLYILSSEITHGQIILNFFLFFIQTIIYEYYSHILLSLLFLSPVSTHSSNLGLLIFNFNQAFSLSLSFSKCSFHVAPFQGVKPNENSSVHIAMLVDVVIVQILFRQLYCRVFQLPYHTQKTLSHSRLLSWFPGTSNLFSLSLSLCQDVSLVQNLYCRFITQIQVSHSQLLPAFCSVMAFF